MKELKRIKEILQEGSRIRGVLVLQAPLMIKIAKQVVTALKNKKKIIVCGNGGSAADSQHMVAELVGRFNRERRPLAAVALTTNTSIITAIGNDYGYEYSFSKQIEAIGQKGDVFFAISTSGNAVNVIEAVRAANKNKLKTIGLSGKTGGLLSKTAGLCLVVPSDSTARIQELHITIIHIICELIEEAFV